MRRFPATARSARAAARRPRLFAGNAVILTRQPPGSAAIVYLLRADVPANAHRSAPAGLTLGERKQATVLFVDIGRLDRADRQPRPGAGDGPSAARGHRHVRRRGPLSRQRNAVRSATASWRSSARPRARGARLAGLRGGARHAGGISAAEARSRYGSGCTPAKWYPGVLKLDQVKEQGRMG